MTEFRQLLSNDPALGLTLGGLAVGVVFGWIAARTNFCTMGAVSDWRSLGDRRRLLSWMLAVAVAMAGVSFLEVAGFLRLETSIYTQPHLNWAGSALGGTMFGIGMVYAGGCPSRALVRTGAGDLRALLVLVVVGISGYATLGGILAPLRARLEQATATQLTEPSQRLGDLLGLDTAWTGLAAALLLAIYCFSNKAFRQSPKAIAAGAGVGLCVAAGWALTGLAYDEISAKPLAVVSLTFVKPTGDTLEWLQRATALGWPGFGIASVAGTVAGSFLAHLTAGLWRVTGYRDVADQLRNLAGAGLMGVGGITGLGCSVGQGITGVSTLALGSLVAAGAIVGGAVIGLWLLERGLDAE